MREITIEKWIEEELNPLKSIRKTCKNFAEVYADESERKKFREACFQELKKNWESFENNSLLYKKIHEDNAKRSLSRSFNTITGQFQKHYKEDMDRIETVTKRGLRNQLKQMLSNIILNPKLIPQSIYWDVISLSRHQDPYQAGLIIENIEDLIRKGHFEEGPKKDYLDTLLLIRNVRLRIIEEDLEEKEK